MNRDRDPDARLEQRARALLDESADALDARTRSRLTQARHAALAELRQPRNALALRRWAPVAAMVALAAVLLMNLPIGEQPATPSVQSAAQLLEDFDLVADAENLELLQDMEFYAWLDATDVGDSG